MNKLKKSLSTISMDFPVLEQRLTAGRLGLLLLYPIVLFLLMIAESTHAKFTNYFSIFLFGSLLPLVLFFLLFRLISKAPINSLFRPIKRSDLKTAGLFMLGYVIYDSISHVLLSGASTANKSSQTVAQSSNKMMSFFRNAFFSLFDLMSEELFAIITFLALLALLYQILHVSQTASILIALLVSSILFGLIHFQAYDWHLTQMLFVIGAARFFITGVYIKTKNLWLAFLIHYLWDVAMFLLVAVF